MTTLLIPEIARSDAELVRRRLEHRNGPPVTGRELSFVCLHIASALEELRGALQETLKEGVSGLRLRGMAREYLEVVESALPVFGMAAKVARDDGLNGEIPNIERAAARAERVRDDITALLRRASSPPPQISEEDRKRFEEAAGPFERVSSVIRRLEGE
jgi:hypothetical protein